MNGFNGAGAWSDVPLLRAAPTQSSHPLSYAINLEIMSAYSAKRGSTYNVPGHKGYPENTIFSFDPAFGPSPANWGFRNHLVTFQVMRRSLGTNLQQHGTLKDTQGVLGHASITTTGNVYVQVVEQSVMRAVNSHAAAVLDG